MLYRTLAPLSLALLALLPSVSAHGALMKVVIDGKSYMGNGPGGDPKTTAIRPTKAYDNGPVKGAINPNLVCGLESKNAGLIADANPGSTVQVLWADGNITWIHDVGPVMTYMAECTGVPDCTTFDASDAQWFKTDELGLKDVNGTTWWMNEFAEGNMVSTTIPKNLKAGNYLLRSELIALHTVGSVGGAEFYPACVQLKVGGDATGTASPTVSIPGLYSDTDPGIEINVYDKFTYEFPGGVVATIGGSAASNSTDSGSSSSSTPTSTESSASTPSGASTESSAPSPSAAPLSSAAAPSSTAAADPSTPSASGSDQSCKAMTKKRDNQPGGVVNRHATGMPAIHRRSTRSP